YAIYLLYRLREEAAESAGDAATAMRRTFQSAGKAVLFVGSAVAGGYAVLMLSKGFLIHIWLGLLISLAVTMSGVAALTLLPALVMLLRPRFLFAPSSRVAAAVGKAAMGGLALALWLSGSASAADATAEEIMKRNFVAMKVGDSVSDA